MHSNSLFLLACAAHGAFAAVNRCTSLFCYIWRCSQKHTGANSQTASYMSNSTVVTSSISSTALVTSTPLPSSLSSPLNSTSSCPWNCEIRYPDSHEYDWVRAETSAVVVATIVLSVNNATNATSTSTIYNTDYEDPMPGATNQAGTQIDTVTVSDPIARTNWSTVVYVGPHSGID